MYAIFITILEIAIWLFPMFLGLVILLRSKDSYEDSYVHSEFSQMGFSAATYRIFFKSIGVALLIFGAAVFFFIYIWENEPATADSDDFWESFERNKQKKENYIMDKQ